MSEKRIESVGCFEEDMQKRCSKCRVEKDLLEFPIRKKLSRDGRNSWCNQCMRLAWRERSKTYLAKQRLYHTNRKKTVLRHYGEICACCGESEMGLLTLDHIDNDGAKHRKIIGRSGAALYRWLLANDFPAGFQVLCFNCNMGKAFFGQCPHRKGEMEEVISDGFGSIWSKRCPGCHKLTMSVVRPGKVQCAKCG